MRRGLLATAVIFAVATLAYAWVALHFEKQRKEQELQRAARFVADATTLDLGRYLNGFRALSYSLVGGPRLQDSLVTTAIRSRLQTFQRYHPSLAAILVLGPHGHLWSQIGVPKKRVGAQAYWAFPKGSRGQGMFVVERPQSFDGFLSLPLWYIRSRDGHPQVAVFAVVSLRKETALWKSMASSPQMVLGLRSFPRHGYRSRSEPVFVSQKGIRDTSVSTPLGRAGVGHRRRPSGARAAFTAYQKLGHYPVVAFASLPTSAVYWAWWCVIRGPVLVLGTVLMAMGLAYREIWQRQMRWAQDRRWTEARLFEAKERVEVTLRSIMDAVITTDIEGRIQYLNLTAERMTGWTHAETQGRLVNEIFPCLDEHKGVILDPLAHCIDGRAMGPEDALLFHRDGRSLSVERTAAPIRDRQGKVTGVVLVFRDVTEKRVLTERLAHQATHDPLTELSNRTLYSNRLQLALSEAAESKLCVALVFLDLDGFKGINDSFGHDAGDRVLVSLAERLRRVVRAVDTLARLGGDEFAVILPGFRKREEILPILHKIMGIFKDTVLTVPEAIFMSASVGVAVYPDDGESVEDLSRSADAAMYEAKAAGKGIYRFYKGSREAIARQGLSDEIRGALERGELHLLYQPQIQLSDRGLVGVEVFPHWPGAIGQVGSPETLLEIAEEAGVSVPLGAWILRSACAQSQRWRQNGVAHGRLVINMTGRQCQQDGVLAFIQGALDDNGLCFQDLVIALTEGLFVAGSELFLILQAFKERGLGLVVQNFGCGFTSFEYLKRVRVDALKIDCAFIAGIGKKESEAIVLAIIALGRALGVKVVAGGVETGEQYRFLKDAGCDVVQGGYVAPPLPVEVATEFFLAYPSSGS